MNVMMKLGLPALLGLLAGAANYLALNSQPEPVHLTCVRVTRDIARGETIARKDLEAFPLLGPPGSLERTALAYRDQALAFDRPANRELKLGDLVLRSDVTPVVPDPEIGPNDVILPISLANLSVEPRMLQVGNEIGFLVNQAAARPVPAAGAAGPNPPPAPTEPVAKFLGPFRLLSVGNRIGDGLVGAGRPTPTGANAANDRIISVAIHFDDPARQNLDAKSRELVVATDPNRAAGRRIVAVVLVPKSRPRPAGEPAVTSGGEATEGTPAATPTRAGG